MTRRIRTAVQAWVVGASMLLTVLVATDVWAAYTQRRATSAFSDRALLQGTLDSLANAERGIDAILHTPGGDWMLVAQTDVWASSGLSPFASLVRLNMVASGRQVVAGDGSQLQVCVVIFHDWTMQTLGTPPASLTTALNNYRVVNWPVRDVEVTHNGFLLLGPGNVATYSTNLDSDLREALLDRHTSNRVIADVSIGFGGEWVLVADHNPMYEGISSRFASNLEEVTRTTRLSSNHAAGPLPQGLRCVRCWSRTLFGA